MSLLQGYYDAVNAENDAKAQAEQAQARNTNAQTGEVAADHAAQRGVQNSESGLNNAKTGQVGADGAAGRVATLAGANQSNANANLLGVQAQVLPTTSESENNSRNAQTNQTLGASQNDRQNNVDAPTQGDQKGGKVVSQKQVLQGKGGKPGPTDTVKAMLTPGEAVLNKGAAEHYGSDVIDHMNKMGLLRMGAQSEHAKLNGLPDPHAKHQTDAKKSGAKGRMVAGGAAPTGNAMPVPISPQPAGGAPAPGPGALPGFWQGTSSVPQPPAGMAHLLTLRH